SVRAFLVAAAASTTAAVIQTGYLFVSRRERTAAAARFHRVRVVNFKAAAQMIVHEIHHRAGHVFQAEGVNENLDVLVGECYVGLLGGSLVNRHAVLQA